MENSTQEVKPIDTIFIEHPVLGKLNVKDVLEDAKHGRVAYPHGVLRVLCEELLHAHTHMRVLESQLDNYQTVQAEFITK